MTAAKKSQSAGLLAMMLAILLGKSFVIVIAITIAIAIVTKKLEAELTPHKVPTTSKITIDMPRRT